MWTATWCKHDFESFLIFDKKRWYMTLLWFWNIMTLLIWSIYCFVICLLEVQLHTMAGSWKTDNSWLCTWRTSSLSYEWYYEIAVYSFAGTQIWGAKKIIAKFHKKNTQPFWSYLIFLLMKTLISPLSTKDLTCKAVILPTVISL